MTLSFCFWLCGTDRNVCATREEASLCKDLTHPTYYFANPVGLSLNGLNIAPSKVNTGSVCGSHPDQP